MTTPRKPVCYRVAGRACQSGYQDTTCGADETRIYALATGGALIPGAKAVPCSECPTEVVVVEHNIYDYEVNIVCAPDGAIVRAQAAWDQTAGPAAPPVMTYWNVVTGVAWQGEPSTLGACAGKSTEADPINWCVDGGDFTQWVILNDGVPTGISTWTNNAGAVVPNPIPAGLLVTKGVCTLPIDEYISQEVC